MAEKEALDTWRPPPQDDTQNYERRIVLVGKTGVGKSAAGNTLLGREAFDSELSPSSRTANCEKAKGVVNGRRVAVIDTPGLFDTHYSREEVLKRIKLCICLAAPGPHAFLVVIQLGRFTEEEQETVKMIQTTFGEEAAKFTMVLFTHGDRLRNQTIEEFVEKSQELSTFVQQCGKRYHVFNNEAKDHRQRWQLLNKIDKMAMANGGGYYTNDMFQRAEEAIEKEKERLLKESEAERQKEIDALRARYSGIYLKKKEEAVHQRYEANARAKAEVRNGFISAAVIGLAVVAGAGIGASIGIVGGPIGIAVGAAVGAAAGAIVGASACLLTLTVSKSCRVQ